MNRPTRIAALLAVALGLCAAAPAARAADKQRYKQADFRFPPEEREFYEDVERGMISTIRGRLARAEEARASGNMDQARAEFAAAAQGAVDFADKFPSIEWRIPLRYNAARLFQVALRQEAAAEQAEKVLIDPMASDLSKAMAAHLAAYNWLGAAFAKAKAGNLDKITLPTAEQRGDRPLAPRPPPGEWKRFVVAADGYAAVAAADPQKDKPASERIVAITPAELALRAAQVEYAFDNMEDARGRFERIIATWPGDAEVMEQAVPLYLQTFAVQKDSAGQAAASARLRTVLAEQVAKATDPKAQAGLAKVRDLVARLETAAGFAAAARLLESGKAAEAGAAFEALAAVDPKAAEAPSALSNAAVAYDRADQPEKAAALRERLLRDYPDSKVAPAALLALAASRSKAGDLERSVALYRQYLERYPDGSFRCGAVQNLGVALEQQKKPLDAAAQFAAFGTDAACVAEDANAAAKLLFHAGELYQRAKKAPEAKAAYQAAARLEGKVTDVVSKSQVVEAKKRAKGP